MAPGSREVREERFWLCAESSRKRLELRKTLESRGLCCAGVGEMCFVLCGAVVRTGLYCAERGEEKV